MRKYNRRLFRLARVILKDDSEAESVLQEAYIAAYSAMKIFGDDSNVSTWLTRNLVNESLGRLLHRQNSDRVVIPFSLAGYRLLETVPAAKISDNRSSEDATLRAELRALLEKKLDELPTAFRTVFVMREVEEMSVEETAESLGIPPATVRSRLFRARALLREALARDIDVAAADVFSFAGARCDRIVDAVLSRLRER